MEPHTRYNLSKTLQKQFGHVAIEQCLNHANRVPDFGPDVRIRMETNFRFPPPKTGWIKNTADIDNLLKFALDACNTIFYGDDGQVVCLHADKAYDGACGSKGYTRMKIEIVSSSWLHRGK
jgi:Holliday junction resolvase RusA-like endonuclease